MQVSNSYFDSKVNHVSVNVVSCVSSSQLKDVCRRELDRSEIESVRNQAVTSEYKQVDFASELC